MDGFAENVVADQGYGQELQLQPLRHVQIAPNQAAIQAARQVARRRHEQFIQEMPHAAAFVERIPQMTTNQQDTRDTNGRQLQETTEIENDSWRTTD